MLRRVIWWNLSPGLRFRNFYASGKEETSNTDNMIAESPPATRRLLLIYYEMIQSKVLSSVHVP